MGRPAWMPGEPCWAKDGPSRRAHGAGPERGAPERSEGRTQGQGLFAYFCGCLAKVSRRKGGTRRKTSYIEWICTLAIWKLRVHIHYMCLAELKVSLLQRGTFGKQPQKYPKGPCPTIRPSSPRLARCLLSGAVMGARRDGPSLARSRLARRPASPPP